jgi:CDP-diacylglycerol--glycerol-3-phosphate 3-phosphatidyltransferase
MATIAAVFFAIHTYEKAAVILCIVAALLDAFDGWYARTFSQCSKLGKHLDPLADKLLMAVVYTLIAFKMQSAAVWILVALIAVREIGMTLIRAYSVRRHKKFIPANRWGKVKMVLQSTFGIVLISYANLWNGGYDFGQGVVVAPLVMILIISYYSAIIYIKSWRKTIPTFDRKGVVGHPKTSGDAAGTGRMVVGE